MKQKNWLIGSSVAVVFSVVFFAVHTNTASSQTNGYDGDGNNRSPFAVAKMSIDNGKTYSSKITVTQGVRVNVRLSAGAKGSAGSFDPDGWDTVRLGVSKGGTIEWNSDLNLGAPTYEKTFRSPKFPTSADMNLGDKIFTVAPGTYTYYLLRITDAGGAVSNIGTVEFTVVENKDPNANKPPWATAKMSLDGGEFSSDVTVIQGVPVKVKVTAGGRGSAGSFDPDGWDTVGKGVSNGGKIEWNSDLNTGEPTFEKTFANPKLPLSADMDLGTKIFTQAPGTYTYNLLRITDAGGLASNIGTVNVTITTGSPQPCNGYDKDCDDDCDVSNAYDGGCGKSLGGSLAKIISPTLGTKFARGKHIPIIVSSGALPSCGTWVLQTPKGERVTLSPSDFVSSKMPWNMPACMTQKNNP